jgi:hypothetical protein
VPRDVDLGGIMRLGPNLPKARIVLRMHCERQEWQDVPFR